MALHFIRCVQRLSGNFNAHRTGGAADGAGGSGGESGGTNCGTDEYGATGAPKRGRGLGNAGTEYEGGRGGGRGAATRGASEASMGKGLRASPRSGSDGRDRSDGRPSPFAILRRTSFRGRCGGMPESEFDMVVPASFLEQARKIASTFLAQLKRRASEYRRTKSSTPTAPSPFSASVGPFGSAGEAPSPCGVYITSRGQSAISECACTSIP